MVNNSVSMFNHFLEAGRRRDEKGGPLTIEVPGAVENIAIQTRSGALDEFEDELADALMAVFADGAEQIADVVAGLDRAGSRDCNGNAWTEAALREQLTLSAAQLFASSEGTA